MYLSSTFSLNLILVEMLLTS